MALKGHLTRTEATGGLMIETETDLERRIKPIQPPLIGRR